MNQFINIDNRVELAGLLSKFNAETLPLWGKMKPQQMVEHMIDNVVSTNGKIIFIADVAPDEAVKQKAKWLYTDIEIPRNIVLGSLPENYLFTGLEAAVQALLAELEAFDEYYKKPGITADHLGYGPMDLKEWLIWHGKHFTHHFKQFGLIPVTY